MSGNTCPHGLDLSKETCLYCENEEKSKKSNSSNRKPTIPVVDVVPVPDSLLEKNSGDKSGGKEKTIIIGPDFGEGPESSSSIGKIVGALISFTWDATGQLEPVREGKNSIGRDGIVNDISFANDRHMSGEHAFILCRGGNYELMDRTSTGGTYLNGEMISSNISVKLDHNDEVRTGKTVWRFIKIGGSS